MKIFMIVPEYITTQIIMVIFLMLIMRILNLEFEIYHHHQDDHEDSSWSHYDSPHSDHNDIIAEAPNNSSHYVQTVRHDHAHQMF